MKVTRRLKSLAQFGSTRDHTPIFLDQRQDCSLLFYSISNVFTTPIHNANSATAISPHLPPNTVTQHTRHNPSPSTTSTTSSTSRPRPEYNHFSPRRTSSPPLTSFPHWLSPPSCCHQIFTKHSLRTTPIPMFPRSKKSASGRSSRKAGGNRAATRAY